MYIYKDFYTSYIFRIDIRGFIFFSYPFNIKYLANFDIFNIFSPHAVLFIIVGRIGCVAKPPSIVQFRNHSNMENRRSLEDDEFRVKSIL